MEVEECLRSRKGLLIMYKISRWSFPFIIMVRVHVYFCFNYYMDISYSYSIGQQTYDFALRRKLSSAICWFFLRLCFFARCMGMHMKLKLQVVHSGIARMYLCVN